MVAFQRRGLLSIVEGSIIYFLLTFCIFGEDLNPSHVLLVTVNTFLFLLKKINKKPYF